MHKGLKLTGPATTGPTVMARGRGGTECQIFVLYAHQYLYFCCVFVFVFVFYIYFLKWAANSYGVGERGD